MKAVRYELSDAATGRLIHTGYARPVDGRVPIELPSGVPAGEYWLRLDPPDYIDPDDAEPVIVRLVLQEELP